MGRAHACAPKIAASVCTGLGRVNPPGGITRKSPIFAGLVIPPGGIKRPAKIGDFLVIPPGGFTRPKPVFAFKLI